MAGALNMLVMHLGVIPVVRERLFHLKVLERLPGDALLDSWLLTGVGVLGSSPAGALHPLLVGCRTSSTKKALL